MDYVGCQIKELTDLNLAEQILTCMNNIYDPVINLLEPKNLPLEPYTELEDDKFNILVPHLFSLISFIVRYHIQLRKKFDINHPMRKNQQTENFNNTLRDFLDKASQREVKDDKFRYKTFMHANDIAIFGAAKFNFKPNCSYFIGLAEFFTTLQQFRDDLEFQQRVVRPIAQLIVFADKAYSFYQLSEEQQEAALKNYQAGQHQQLIISFGQNFAINFIEILIEAAEDLLTKADVQLNQSGTVQSGHNLSLDMELLYKIYMKVSKTIVDATAADGRAEQTEYLRKQGIFDFGGPWVSAADALGLKAALDGVTLHLMAQNEQSGTLGQGDQQTSGVAGSPMWPLIQKTIFRSAQLLAGDIEDINKIMPYSYNEYRNAGQQITRQKQNISEEEVEEPDNYEQQIHPAHRLILELLDSSSGLHEVQFALGVQLKYEEKINISPESEYEELILACALRAIPEHYAIPAIEKLRGLGPRLVYYAKNTKGLQDNICKILQDQPNSLINQDIRLLLWLSSVQSVSLLKEQANNSKDSKQQNGKNNKKGQKQLTPSVTDSKIEPQIPEPPKNKALNLIKQLFTALQKSNVAQLPSYLIAKYIFELTPAEPPGKGQQNKQNSSNTDSLLQLPKMQDATIEELLSQIKECPDEYAGAFFKDIFKGFIQQPEQMLKIVDPILRTVKSKLPGGSQTGDWSFLLIIGLCVNQKISMEYRQEIITKAGQISTGFITSQLIKELLLSEKHFQILNKCILTAEQNRQRQKEYFQTKQLELQRQYSDLHIYNTEDLGNMSEDDIADIFERRDIEHWNEEIRIKQLLQYLNEGEAWQKIQGPGIYFKGYDKSFADHQGLAYMQNYLTKAQYMEIDQQDLLGSGYNIFGRIQVKMTGFQLSGNEKQTALKRMLELDVFKTPEDEQDIIRNMD